MRKIVLAVILCTGLAGCGSSPPTHFFTLDPVAGNTAKTMAGPPVQVNAVHMPPELDRLSMVRETSANALKVDEQNRWGAPLDDLARRVLVQDLSNRLPAGKVVPPDTPPPDNALSLVVDISRFQPDASGNVTLDAVWTLTKGTPSKMLHRAAVHLSDNGGGTSTDQQAAAQQAAAMSRLMGQLADRIAAALGTASGAS